MAQSPPISLQTWQAISDRKMAKRVARRNERREECIQQESDDDPSDWDEYCQPRHLHMGDSDDSVPEWSDDDTDANWELTDDDRPPPCCNRRCSELGAEEHLALYQANYLMPYQDRRSFIRSRIKFKRVPGRGDRRVFYMDNFATYASVNGASLPNEMDWQSMEHDHIHVCAQYFTQVYRVSNNFIYQPSVDGNEISLERKIRDRAITSKANIITQWIKDLADFYQADPTSNDRFLPFYRKHVVWDLFVDEQTNLHPDLSWSSKYFYHIWRTENKNVKVRAWLKFAKCDECVAIRKERKATKQGANLDKIRAREKAHIKFVKAERLSYYKRRRRGVDTPDTHMSIVIDGADQQAYALPYHHVQTHSSQKAIRVPIHVYGVMVHGIGTWAYVYHDNVRQGTNVTVDVLFRTLAAIEDSGRTLPDTLYIQLDNTVKQNKSKFFMSYLAWLVKTGAFKRIVVSFLPVGHTHEDIDQLFSRIAVLLRRSDARSRVELGEVIQLAYHKAGLVNNCPTVISVDSAINWSDFIEPFLKPMTGLTSYYQFEIKVHPDLGEPVVRVKKWCGVKEEYWRGLAGHTPHHVVFRTPKAGGSLPYRLSSAIIPPSQRPDCDTKEQTKVRVKSLRKYGKARCIPASVLADVITMVRAQGCGSDIPFDLPRNGRLNKMDTALAAAYDQGSDADSSSSDEDGKEDRDYGVDEFVMIRAADSRNDDETDVSHCSM
jgi:hypothetical protein